MFYVDPLFGKASGLSTTASGLSTALQKIAWIGGIFAAGQLRPLAANMPEINKVSVGNPLLAGPILPAKKYHCGPMPPPPK